MHAKIPERPGGGAHGRACRPCHGFPKAAALAAAAGLLAAVLVPAASAAAPRPATPQVPVLHWRSCDGGFQCATARVPLNYRDPGGVTIGIGVIRHLATGPGKPLGSLFFNGGGPNPMISIFPGKGGVYSAFPPVLRERYDIVTFDPRGFGYSTQIRCFPTEAAEHRLVGNLPPFPVGRTQEAAYERAYAKLDARCAADAGPLLDHDTTADTARDMNLLREALADPVLNYYGESYGTLLGATYANLFPGTTGRMILDGNINPITWTTADGGLPSWLRLGRDQAAAATLRDFLDLCGKTTTAACAFSAGTPAATQAKWATLLRRLRRHPVTIGNPPQTYTYADAVASVLHTLGTVTQWREGANVIQQLWAASAAPRRDASTSNPAAVTRASSPAAATAAPYSGVEQQLAVLCSDSPNPRNPRVYPGLARLSYARSGPFGPQLTWKSEECAAWPAAAAQDRYTGPWNRPTTSTILLLGNTGDPVTSYQDSVALSRELARARLLTIDGYGHTETSNPSTCAMDYVVRYLLTDALPPAGTVCPQNATPFAG